VKQFKAAKVSLGDLDAEAAATLVAAAADVSLILDANGVVRDLAFDSEQLSLEGYETWLGRPWIDTVTIESRPKVEELLREAATHSPARWRQVNHPATHGADVPILYSVVPIGRDGRLVAIGRDLRGVAALQRQLIEAQQSIERDYARLRHVEARYRLLFQMSSEGVLIVDVASRRVLEANPTAARLLGEPVGRSIERVFADGLDAAGREAATVLLASVRAVGRPEDAHVRSTDGQRVMLLSASLFRQERSALFLIRLSAQGVQWDTLPQAESALLKVVKGVPDAVVVTDLDGRVQSANGAFLDLAQLATEEQAVGQSLDRWIGRPGVDFGVLLANLRQHGTIRLFWSTLRGEYGATAEVELSGVAVEGDQPCLGFAIRDVSRRLGAEPRSGRQLPRSVEQMTELVGRVPLKELVRETTDVIERMCIEAALELTGDNRASAAEMLGLSRQSLYVKLRRYGLGDLVPEAEE
jgi:transcriptional regulator PpsR